MREYENIAYLDLRKTGSTTIKTVLADILDEKQVHKTNHGGIRADFDRPYGDAPGESIGFL